MATEIPKPPRWAQRLLAWLHPSETLEEVEGDLEELYAYWYWRAGKIQADLRYVLNVMSALPPFVRRRQRKENYYQQPSTPDMLRNYFKTAWRNLVSQKGHSFINIFGLSVGIACFTLFVLYALHEFSFDRFHTDATAIYRVFQWNESANEGETSLPMPLGPAMKRDLPGVQEYVRIREAWRESFIKTSEGVSRAKISFADPQFFTVFSFQFKEGNAATALRKVYDVVLTEKTAKQIWGRTDVVGKTIEVKVQDKFEVFEVSGVTEDILSNSSISFQMLGNFDFLTTVTPDGRGQVNDWNYFSSQTYIQFEKPNSVTDDKTLAAFYRKYNADAKEAPKENDPKSKNLPKWYGFQSLPEIHLDTKLKGATVAAVDPKTIRLLLIIASGILLIACINFTTLAIGRSANRSKEVGVRKVMGESKRSLFVQFMVESLLFTVLSALLSFVLLQILLPSFNQLSGKELHFSFIQFPELIGITASLIAVVAVLAGIYPAIILSGLKPAIVLKMKVKLGGSNFFTRSLVTIQFALSTALVIATVIILKQLHYMESKTPGFNKQNIIVVDADGTWPRQIYPLFKQELAAYSGISGITGSDQRLGGSRFSNTGLEINGKSKKIYEFFVANDFLPVMGMKLLAGRNFNPTIASDTLNAVIINETMMKEFGWTPDNVIGQSIKGYRTNLKPVIIGVVKDFNFQPFKVKIEPQLFHQFAKNRPYKYFVAIKPGHPAQSLAILETTWKKIVPDFPFKYSFLDEDLDRLYQAESQWGKIVGWAGGISVFLACMGLLGLISLAVVNRTKEIGVRKILGASVFGIVGLLSKDFLKLIGIAILIASPIAWYAMHRWLEDFAYRIDIEWWVFALAGLLTVGIALLTVSFQSIKAALVNPVKSLRSE